MPFLARHGRHTEPDVGAGGCRQGPASLGGIQVTRGVDGPACPEEAAGSLARFGYYCLEAQEPGPVPGMSRLFDDLADAMAGDPSPARADSLIPPVFTFLGQFIDHDIHAPAYRDTDVPAIGPAEVDPVPRQRVLDSMRNLRPGALNLDCVFGSAPARGGLAGRLADAMRWPPQPAKLQLGTRVDLGLGAVPFPADRAGDLPRLHRLIRGPHRRFTETEIRTLPGLMRDYFVNPDGSLRVQRAIVGDTRNDDNLFVAQLHLAFMRLHNRIVDVAGRSGGPAGDPDATFAWARRATTWIYQWLVVNVYLPTVCDPGVVARVIAAGAPLYAELMRRHPSGAPGQMVLPLEFCAAAFRFGHSTVRTSYDWSRFLGRPEPAGPVEPAMDGAPLDLLFAATGNAARPMPLADGSQAPGLPAHWAPEWDRLAVPVCGGPPHRSARRIGSHMALPLSTMEYRMAGGQGALRTLMRQQLRRGLRLGLPSAQACIDSVESRTGEKIRRLTGDELLAGPTGEAMRRGGFEIVTPLWFYVLKEAEISGQGQHLGLLGSRLVAETLAGLVLHDPRSYWHATGSDGGRWHPNDGPKPAGEAVTSIPALLRAAALM